MNDLVALGVTQHRRHHCEIFLNRRFFYGLPVVLHLAQLGQHILKGKRAELCDCYVPDVRIHFFKDPPV